MTYTVAVGLGLAGAVAIDVAVLRTRLVASRVFWVAYAIVFCFQLLINGILTTWGVVQYRAAAILGVRLIGAPVEDLAFGFALVLLTLALWTRAAPQALDDHEVGGTKSPRS
jgi:lycopene cyclase domain-containing protein